MLARQEVPALCTGTNITLGSYKNHFRGSCQRLSCRQCWRNCWQFPIRREWFFESSAPSSFANMRTTHGKWTRDTSTHCTKVVRIFSDGFSPSSPTYSTHADDKRKTFLTWHEHPWTPGEEHMYIYLTVQNVSHGVRRNATLNVFKRNPVQAVTLGCQGFRLTSGGRVLLLLIEKHVKSNKPAYCKLARPRNSYDTENLY